MKAEGVDCGAAGGPVSGVEADCVEVAADGGPWLGVGADEVEAVGGSVLGVEADGVEVGADAGPIFEDDLEDQISRVFRKAGTEFLELFLGGVFLFFTVLKNLGGGTHFGSSSTLRGLKEGSLPGSHVGVGRRNLLFLIG